MQVDYAVLIHGVTPQQVFKLISDLRNDKHWWKAIEYTRVTTEIKRGKGTHYFQKSKMLGVPVRSVVEVIDFQPPKTLTIRNLRGVIKFTAKYVLTQKKNATKYRMIADVQIAGVLIPLAPIVKLILRMQTQRNFSHLKAYLEAKYSK
jgi:hypothetical protein